MQKNHLKKMFQLQGYILDRIEYKLERTFVYCHIQKKSMILKGERSFKVSETRMRRLPHLMLEDKMIVLVLTQRRFYFSKYKTKRWEPLPDVSPRKQTTNTFRLNTLRELQRDNYSGTGYKRHKSNMFPMHILDGMDFKQGWDKPITKVGLDGKGVGSRKVVHNITNLDENKPLIVLPNLSQVELKKNFLRCPKN